MRLAGKIARAAWAFAVGLVLIAPCVPFIAAYDIITEDE